MSLSRKEYAIRIKVCCSKNTRAQKERKREKDAKKTSSFFEQKALLLGVPALVLSRERIGNRFHSFIHPNPRTERERERANPIERSFVNNNTNASKTRDA